VKGDTSKEDKLPASSHRIRDVSDDSQKKREASAPAGSSHDVKMCAGRELGRQRDG
jgi:hypothetical protein